MGRPAETLANVTLAGSGLDRRAELRSDRHLLGRLLADPDTRVLELRGDRVAADEGPDGARLRLRSPEASDGEGLAVFLGADVRDVMHVGVVGDPLPHEDGAGGSGPLTGGGADGLVTLRHVAADLDDLEAGMFATLLALANWHRAHGHCARCGAPTEPQQSGWVRRCTSEGSEHYPRTDVAVIMSVVDEQDRLLMAQGAGWGTGRYSVLAGFLEPGESLAQAVAREVREEVGLEVVDVRYLGDQPWPFPTSLMVGFTARADSGALRLQESEIADARWFTRDEVRAGVADGSLAVSSRLSISRRLVEHWLGHEIAGVR
ncbi:NAD(+) diphosphatase [Pedococcus sp. NPDC057267]|uniref:NAD(+) diphosphatase n=1 Tax=Pedococcus sp. NPDC057267 TaxID=3346077 RepID=UPI0036403510